MTNVYSWPPVGLTAWEITRHDPVSRSAELFSGRSRSSSFQRSRRLATANVHGIGSDLNGSGYIENLKRLLDGGTHLVRMNALPPLWYLAAREFDLTSTVIEWTSGGTEMLWTAGGIDLIWGDGDYALNGAPATDGGWPAVTVTGLPANAVIARPSQRITITDTSGMEASTVLTQARSDATGTATIRIFEAFTKTGMVSIGDCESIVFEALGMPRAVQPVSGSFGYQWDFREVFADEFDSWTELDPWA